MTELETRPPSGRRLRQKPLWIAVAVVVVIGVAVGLALFQPWRIFTRSTVDEALPVAASAQNQVLTPAVTAPELTMAPAITPETAVAPAQTPDVAGPTGPGPTPEGQVADLEASTAAETVATVEPAPPIAVATEPIVIAAGTFVDGEHSTSGTASILQLPDGSKFVRLEGFSTSDGPDVHVWVTDQQAGGDDWGKYDDGRYIPLGSLKGTDGNQNYAVPADADLTGLSSVVIWCDRFNVAFGSAAVTL